MCSGCGQIVAKGLSVRVHRCDCGLEIDRDVNAARNIHALGLSVEALTWPVAACVVRCQKLTRFSGESRSRFSVVFDKIQSSHALLPRIVSAAE